MGGDEEAGLIVREAGDKQKGLRFQKLRAAVRFLERVEANTSGRVYCAIELLEDSLVIDASAPAVLSGEENKSYSSPLSFNSSAIKNTLVAFLDIACTFQQSSEISLGVYASAALADEKVRADQCAAAGLAPTGGMYGILKKLVKGEKLADAEQKVARYLAIEEYRAQYASKGRSGFLGLIETWSAAKFNRFLEQIDWAISVESNNELEGQALKKITSSRLFNYRHQGLESFILSRLLDLLEKRSQSERPLDRMVSTTDVEMIFLQIVSDAKLEAIRKPDDPAADAWSGVGAADQRNLEEKILAVSPEFPPKALKRLARRCTLARLEAQTFAREYVSLRRRLLDVCEHEIEALQLPPQGYSPQALEQIIEDLTAASFSHLQQLSQSYQYKINDIETTRGAVLTLFDDCFVAFD